MSNISFQKISSRSVGTGATSTDRPAYGAGNADSFDERELGSYFLVFVIGFIPAFLVIAIAMLYLAFIA